MSIQISCSGNSLGWPQAKRKYWLWTTFSLDGCENICARGPDLLAVFVPVLVLVSASASWLLLSYSCERARLYSNCFTRSSFFIYIDYFLVLLQIWCQQIYEGRLEDATGSHKCGDRQFAGSAAVAAVNATATVSAAADGPGLRLCAQSQLLSTRWVEFWWYSVAE